MSKELTDEKMASLMKIINDVSSNSPLGKISRLEVKFKSDHPLTDEVNKRLAESGDDYLRDMRVHIFEAHHSEHELTCRRVWDPVKGVYVVICH